MKDYIKEYGIDFTISYRSNIPMWHSRILTIGDDIGCIHESFEDAIKYIINYKKENLNDS